jgi:CRISPR-associated protein Cst2
VAYETDLKLSPAFREEKVAYTDGNPILYWDDDLLGYMRASNDSAAEEKAIEAGLTRRTSKKKTKKGGKEDVEITTLTRISPFRTGTLIAIERQNIAKDFGVMARAEGDPVPSEHQFYRVSLQGLFSIDLRMAGKFFYLPRTGFQNLDEVRKEQARQHGLEDISEESAFRLPLEERIDRIKGLLTALGRLQGGAKQTLHYTDVTPAVTVLAFTRGGNHPFNYLFSDYGGSPRFNDDVLANAVHDARDDLLSPVFIGWKHGYLPVERAKAEQVSVEGVDFAFGTPREALGWAADWLAVYPDHWDR